MLTVHKYPVPIEDHFTLELPQGAKLLSFHEQHGRCHLWALVDTTTPKIPRRFRLCGTGHPVEHARNELHFVGTALTANGSLVWHLFELLKAL